MAHATETRHGLWDAPASHSPRKKRMEQILVWGLFAHPVAAITFSLVAVGVGMLLAVSAFTLLLTIPLGLLLGWI